jgi:3',5'-cyclic AMP phosphodiesterase CpdA
MRIVHFSDIHAGGWIESVRGYFDKRLLGAFNFLLRRKRSHDWSLVDRAVKKIKALSPDVVICTGDLSSISEPGEFARAVKALTPLVENDHFEFFYVPGNHDLYVNDPVCLSSLERTFYSVNREKWQLSELPLAVERDGFSFLLLNEALPVGFYKSTGLVDRRTVDWLETRFQTAPDNTTILVGHFPIFDKCGKHLSFRRRCEGNEVLQQALLDGKIYMSLCGHIHSHFIRQEKNGSVEICAGSLTHSGVMSLVDCNPDTKKLSHQWIDVRS